MIIFCSGDKAPLELSPGERRFMVDTEKLVKLIAEQANEINHWCCKSEVAIGVIDGAVISICAYSHEEAVEDGFEGVESEFHCVGTTDL